MVNASATESITLDIEHPPKTLSVEPLIPLLKGSGKKQELHILVVLSFMRQAYFEDIQELTDLHR